MNQEHTLLGASAARRKLPVGDRYYLRLLSAHEMVQCTTRAKALVLRLFSECDGDKSVEALAGNAVLASMAVVGEDDKPVFPDGEGAFKSLCAEELNSIAEHYADMRGELFGSLEKVKKNLSGDPHRIMWRVLRAFNRLPTDAAVRRMSEGDFLYCYLNLLLDEEGEGDTESGFNRDFDRAVRADREKIEVEDGAV